IFLSELAESDVAEADGWHECAPDETNPLEAEDLGRPWPFDPLDERRAELEQAAELVRAAAGSGAAAAAEHHEHPLAVSWAHDVDLLLAERARAATAGVIEVALPEQLAVSDVVTLTADPAALARRLRRPLPQQPARQARRGTAFHQWLEQRWSAQTLIDIEELAGAVDEVAADDELDALKATFERSEWADRTPLQVEVGFEMPIGARVIRGRMDAVFQDPDGGFTVIDWKTGRPPTGTAAQAQSVQLALYRLAWARLLGLPDAELIRVKAAFYYVRTGTTVAPVDLLDADQLRALLEHDAGPETPPRSTALRDPIEPPPDDDPEPPPDLAAEPPRQA
ncbi:MAG TPA: PD-(D/E)XK nuclease family protein, partial [Jatrophihabitans sp.]|nr:PD-(D/E)XK nuclease family protein [Jatrophihabitans sp.]